MAIVWPTVLDVDMYVGAGRGGGGASAGLSPMPPADAVWGWAWSAARRRFGHGVGSLWRLANAVVGRHLLSTNIDPPWAAS